MTEKNRNPEVRFKGFNDEWKELKLKNMAESCEYGLNAAAIKFDGANKYIRITDIDDETHEFKTNALTSPGADLSFADNFKLKEGDILFARTGASVGKTYNYKYSDGLVYYAGFLIRARIKPSFDTEFVFQSTLTNRYNNFIRLTSQRSGQPGVNAQEYSNFNILVPKLNEQQQIGIFSNFLDKLITLHQAKHNKLITLKKAMLEKMFPKNGADVPEIRFKGFEGAWEECKLKDVSTYLNGGSFENDAQEKGQYELVTLKSVDMDGNLVHSRRYVDIEAPTLTKGTLVMILSEQSPGLIGMTAQIPIDNTYILNQRVAEIRPIQNIDSYFLSIAINKNQPYFSKRGAGTKVQNISKPNVENYEFPCTLIQEQGEIGTYFQNLDKLITLHQKKLEKLKNIKKACLEKMFV